MDTSTSTLTEEQTVADAVHAATLGRPETQSIHLGSNAETLDTRGSVTEDTINLKEVQILKIQAAMGEVRSYRIGLGPLQAVVVGCLAEFLPMRPTNKELARAMSEGYNENYQGPKALTLTRESDDSVEKYGVEPVYAATPKGNPNPYAQAVRKYKILAQIEIKQSPIDKETHEPEWDLSLVAAGVLINSVRYTSPIAALESGIVTMEAVFQCYMNILQPRKIDFNVWSTSNVNEARAFAPKVKVTVRRFNEKMNHDHKVSIAATSNAGVMYGLICGLLETATDKAEFKLGRKKADHIISLVNGLTSDIVEK